MANKTGNRLTVRTKQALITAYLELLQESPSENIKISEICKRANLSRPTFYNHFQTKDEILLSYLDEILEEMFKNFRKKQAEDNPFLSFNEAATNFFKLWKSKANLFALIKANKVECLLIEKLKDHHLTTYHEAVAPLFPIHDEEILEYFTSHISYIFFSILEEWMDKKMKRTPEEMGELLAILFNPLLIKPLSERYGRRLP